jgi:hypothetical protein
MRRARPPKKGCFTSAYPSTQWREVQCTTAPQRPYFPKHGVRPSIVGNGNDVSAQGIGDISQAVGSFDSVSGVTSETGQQGANAFSLQLNTNNFTTSACSGAENPSKCHGWQQFIYSNSGQDVIGVFSNFAAGFMEYWLLGYGSNCPSGWSSYGDSCWKNSGDAVPIVKQDITNLGDLSVAGFAAPSGDSVTVGVGSEVYAAFGDDTVLNLAQGWKVAEFNVVGDCCGTEANFNSGATIVVRTAVDTASSGAPSCVDDGTTAETNNLSFAAAPANPPAGLSPALVFTESTSGAAASPCQSASAIGELIPPTPSSPSGTINTLTPTMIWSGGANFNSLDVHILRNSAPPTVVYESPLLPASPSTLALPAGVLEWGGNYMWQIEACGSPNGAIGAGACLDNDSLIFFSTEELFAITVAVAPTGGGTANGGGTFPAGGTPTVIATANSGYVFGSWAENGQIVSRSASYQLPPLNANESLIANFLKTTATTLSSAPNPSKFGQAVTFRARVTASPFGSVTFMDGSTTLGSAGVSSFTGFVASFTTTKLNVGNHTITATYDAGPGFANSRSAPVVQIVVPNNQLTPRHRLSLRRVRPPVVTKHAAS